MKSLDSKVQKEVYFYLNDDVCLYGRTEGRNGN